MTKSNSDAQNTQSVLGRLLGPADAELSCDQCFELLDEYGERELAERSPDDAIVGMRAHLEGCSACREEHDSLLALLRTDR